MEFVSPQGTRFTALAQAFGRGREYQKGWAIWLRHPAWVCTWTILKEWPHFCTLRNLCDMISSLPAVKFYNNHQPVFFLFLKYFFNFSIFKFLDVLSYLCMCVYHMHTWGPWRPEEGIGSSGSGVKDHMSHHYVGAGQQTQVLFMSSRYSLLLNHHFSPRTVSLSALSSRTRVTEVLRLLTVTACVWDSIVMDWWGTWMKTLFVCLLNRLNVLSF